MTDSESQVRSQSPSHTGYFRDGIRRVDMVLVVLDDGDDATELIKINYLLNALRFGLEVELEPGVMNMHKRLVFIKMHAPVPVIEEYGPKFGIWRPFKEKHAKFINTRWLSPIYHRIAFWENKKETEWIETVRNQYPEPRHYSTLERSLIVHRILLMLPFGNEENYVGLYRLLRNRIVLDAFPLHDGPYISAPEQTPETYNARQMLYYKGLGLTSVVKALPLNLIHEYFGDRLAFFLAFYGFYNVSFIVPAVIGARALITELFNTTNFRDYNYTCNVIGDHYYCPQCRDFLACPFRKIKVCCEAIKYHFILDQDTIYRITTYITIWGVLFVLFWRRREYYWSWMWETNIDLFDDLKSHDYIGKEKKILERAGKKKYHLWVDKLAEPMTHFIVRLTIFFACVGVWVAYVMALLLFNNRLFSIVRQYMPERNENDGTYTRHYVTMGIFSAVNAVLMIIMEKVCFVSSYAFNKLEKYKTQGAYERALVLKLFGLTFMFNCWVFCYLAFVKGSLFEHPAHPVSWFQYEGIAMMLCNPVGCLDELALSIIVALCIKEFLYKAMIALYNICFLKTDNNQVWAPCWEREYRLTPIRDDFVMNKFTGLALQFALAIVFVTGFPLAPLFILIINFWDMKYTAWRLTLGGRRPLLQPGRGVGAWLGIFALLAILTLIMNTAMEFIASTRIRYIEAIGARLFYTLSTFHFAGYKHNSEIHEAFKKFTGEHNISSDRCYFSGPYMYNKANDSYIYQPWRRWYVVGSITEKIIRHMYLGMVIPVSIIFLIPSRAREVEETIYSEKQIVKRNYPQSTY